MISLWKRTKLQLLLPNSTDSLLNTISTVTTFCLKAKWQVSLRNSWRTKMCYPYHWTRSSTSLTESGKNMMLIEVDLLIEEKLSDSWMTSSWPKERLQLLFPNSTNSSMRLILTKMDMLIKQKWQDSWSHIWAQFKLKIKLQNMWWESSKSLMSTETVSLTKESALLCLMKLLLAKGRKKLLSHNSTDSSLNTTSTLMAIFQRMNALNLLRNSSVTHKLSKTKLPIWWEILN